MATLESSSQTNSIRVAQIVINALIVALWLWLYRAIFAYLAIIFTYEDFRTNQIVLVGVIVLIAINARKEKWTLHFDTTPRVHLPALVIAIGGSVLYLAAERWLDVNTLSASLFFLASYGLIGLWITPQRWRVGLPAALLIVGVLPFGDHMQTFIGYPMRIFTASLVRDSLSAFGVASIGVDTILILENGVSQIDLPCSGIKSLWTGALFLIAATWIERRPLNARWFLIAIAFALLLFVTNLARVAILVFVGQVLNSRLAAELIHAPLGVLGFVIACAAGVALLCWQSADQNRTQINADERRLFPNYPRSSALIRVQFSSFWFSITLAVTFFAMGFAYAPRPQIGLMQPPRAWNFSGEFVTQPIPLKPIEIEWLMRDNAESAERVRFEWRGITGSLMFVTSTTWRAHHRPERCFEVYGLAINDSRAFLIAPDFPVRIVALGDARKTASWVATYWFQSADRITDDYGTRIADDLRIKPNRWVLVSILFDGARDSNAPDTRAFYFALRDLVARNLGE